MGQGVIVDFEVDTPGLALETACVDGAYLRVSKLSVLVWEMGMEMAMTLVVMVSMILCSTSR